ncbi:MAG: leucine-rich repeat domain-containing protein [Pirellulales bacterium]
MISHNQPADSNPVPRPKRESAFSELAVVVFGILFLLILLLLIGSMISWWIAPSTQNDFPIAEDGLATQYRKIGMEIGLNSEGKIQVITTPHPLLITDKDLAHITGLPELVVLDLKGTQITDDALQHLHDLPKLTELYLGGSIITDIEPEFFGPRITNQGLEHLSHLNSLKVLSLARIDIDDQGLEHLTQLPNLEILYLIGTDITDEGIPTLGQLKSLKRLFIHDTSISEAGLKRLNSLLPETRIEHHFILPDPAVIEELP